MTSKEYEASLEIGDTVTIREWDDLVKEYGLDHNGDIFCENPKYEYPQKYKILCGNTFTIDKIDFLTESAYKFQLCFKSDDVHERELNFRIEDFVIPNKSPTTNWDTLILEGVKNDNSL